MAKLIVEVIDACNLMPKDGKGSANPYVEVEFDGQRQRTQTKPIDLNPQWNESLAFDVKNVQTLSHKTIDVFMYNDRRGGGGGSGQGHQPNNFMGRVRISGDSISLNNTQLQPVIQRYPLEKRGIFSHIKGDIALKIYLVTHNLPNSNNNNNNNPLEKEREVERNEIISDDDDDDDDCIHHIEQEESKNDVVKKKKKPEVRTFHSIGTAVGGGGGGGAAAYEAFQMKAPTMETRTDFARAVGPGPLNSSVMQMQGPRMNPEYLLTETSPPLAARMRYRGGGNKTNSTYDMVEQMHYLYVSVVKARDLPVMDVSGSLDPYVEVKLGNYKGVTKHLERNQNPVWRQIFAFSKERLQSNLLEVTVKDKDIGKDDVVGRVQFDLSEVPMRVPPDSPLAPQWYRLEDRKGMKIKGEVMLAVWIGTQADESFPEAWHSDAHSINHSNLANTRSKVFFSPKLYYLRVHVIEAQDLVPSERGRAPDVYVKVVLGNQMRPTRPAPMRSVNPIWNDELMFVVSEPFEDMIIVSVDDRVGPGKEDILGRVMIPVRDVPPRFEPSKLPDPRWYPLFKPSVGEEEGEKKKEKFASRILLRFCLDAGYHVLDESTHFSSDLQPSAKQLRKPGIGILELGILSARNLMPMKGKDGRSTDSYCVAKYGNKWVRTRTLLDTLHPKWNEQYTWEVFDPCTVITIAVFDNCHINGGNEARDQRIGKVRIRLSTLEIDRVYTHYYPLLVLTPGGLKKHGELHLALRFTCTGWANMVIQYGKPLLPKLHYAQPIAVRHIDWLRHQAMQIVAARLGRAEPPLRREVVEYMLDVDYHMWSLRRSKANFHRIMSLLTGVTAVCRWFDDICNWRNPVTTCLVHVLFLILVCYPELILPTIFLYLFVIGIWNYRFRPRHPPHMDARLSQADSAHPDELDEEFDSFPSSRPSDIARMRYDRLRSVAGRVQTVVGDLATQGERTQSILSWRDPRATAIFIFFSLIWAVFIYVTPFQVVAIMIGLFMLRHPRFRRKTPSVPVNFFKRLASKSDMLL